MQDGSQPPAEYAGLCYLKTSHVKSYIYSLLCQDGPIWFSIKSNTWSTDGSKHFLEMIKLMQPLPTAIKAVVWPVIQRNAYWAHPVA